MAESAAEFRQKIIHGVPKGHEILRVSTCRSRKNGFCNVNVSVAGGSCSQESGKMTASQTEAIHAIFRHLRVRS